LADLVEAALRRLELLFNDLLRAGLLDEHCPHHGSLVPAGDLTPGEVARGARGQP
jgi:hypothetical protein